MFNVTYSQKNSGPANVAQWLNTDLGTRRLWSDSWFPLFGFFSKRRRERRNVIKQRPKHWVGHLGQWAEWPGRKRSGDGHSFSFFCQPAECSARESWPRAGTSGGTLIFPFLSLLPCGKQAWEPPWPLPGLLAGFGGKYTFSWDLPVVPPPQAWMDMHLHLPLQNGGPNGCTLKGVAVTLYSSFVHQSSVLRRSLKPT